MIYGRAIALLFEQVVQCFIHTFMCESSQPIADVLFCAFEIAFVSGRYFSCVLLRNLIKSITFFPGQLEVVSQKSTLLYSFLKSF